MGARIFTVAVMACAIASSSLATQDGPDLSAQQQPILTEFPRRYGFPGATAAIAVPDDTLSKAVLGLADLEAGRQMTPETRMLTASISKTFVAAIVLALRNFWLTDLGAGGLISVNYPKDFAANLIKKSQQLLRRKYASGQCMC